ncbi:DUF4097 family beta strand repeat-containing protein [Jatrophihabitans telluris]|uniref:DUF4097 family beta strand repeat-containing protein n=1 Tax=Jatrophihabitans telluris TaxID=2038343 RepID=A0ABY4QV58_9ACTN|nr:DUF4097 family beta strand repeat-containing protein [Jatrophihabitans telluris]UQX86761.1 DUF4097 family beta strand repeat-containing protein [Jatrophihabitans telluris]
MPIETFPLSGPINLQARFALGSLSVRAEDGLSEARVEVTPRAPRSSVLDSVSVAMRGPTLMISGPRPRGGLLDLAVFGGPTSESDAIDVVAVVPTGTAMKVTTLSATVSVAGTLGGVDIAGRTTELNLDGADGDVRVRSGNGSSTLHRVRGSVEIRSGSNEVDITEVSGAVDIGIGTGTARIGLAHDAVRLRSGSGELVIEQADGDVDLTTGSGSLSVGIAAGHQVRLDLLTGHGELRTEMPVTDQPTTAGLVKEPSRRSSIRARTGNGDITVRRTAPTAEQPAT